MFRRLVLEVWMFRRLRTYVMCAFGSGPGAHYMMSNCETGELDRVSDLERNRSTTLRSGSTPC